MARERYVSLVGNPDVARIKQGIPLDRIRIQKIEYPTEMWGIIVLDGLPFYFQQSRSHGIHQDSGLDIHGKESKIKQIRRPTSWFTHAPYKPLGFTPPIFAGEVEDEDKKFILNTLGIRQRDIYSFRVFLSSLLQGGSFHPRNEEGLDFLYKRSLQKREKDYEKVFQKYYGNPIFGAAVLETCETYEPVYNASLQRKGQE